jgi:Na+-driven multidrug efflux pump
VGYLRLVACFYLFNFLGSGLSGYCRGRGWVSMAVMGTTGHISIRVILSALLAARMGLEAVALASGIGWIFVVAFWTLFRKWDFRQMDS